MRISRNYFAKLVTDFCTAFVRVSHEYLENFHVSRTSHELVAKVLNMFKNFMRIFTPKIFGKTVVRHLCEYREPVAVKFWQIYNAKFSQHSYKCCKTVARQS